MTRSRSSPRSEAILLLHGQPGGARDWERVIARLREHRGERTLPAIAFDRPGWDASGVPRDLAGNAAAVLSALDARGLERATIVGHSFGAAIAVWLGAARPDRVAALVLLAPAANVASLQRIDYWLAAPVAGRLLSTMAMAGPGLVLAGPRARASIASRFGLDEDYLRAAGGILRRPSAWRAFVVEQRTLIRELPELESRLARVAAPTTIVIGSGDRIVRPSSARRLAAQIPDAELVSLPGAGHLLSLRHPGRIAQVVLAAAGVT